MINNTASLDLVEFVETKILPKYANFDKAHNMEHVTRVIRNSMALARTTGADVNMVYVIAAAPDATARPATPPSRAAIRSSNTLWVELVSLP